MMRDLRHQQHARTSSPGLAPYCALAHTRTQGSICFMFVTNHVLSGVVIGRALKRHPVAAFVAGVASHLVLDMVPHWGCTMRTEEEKRLFLRYAQRDGLLGLAVTASAIAAVDPRTRPTTLAAIVGAALLDADKPMVHFFGRNPFPRSVRRIHQRIQNESPGGLPAEMAFGFSCALADVIIAVRGRRRRGIAGSVCVGRVLV